jgi:predicted amidohydrolase YtcJ
VVLDARGGAVLPGFNDSHTHLMSGGLSMNQINLLDARTLPAIESTVREWVAAHPDEPWVVGRGWLYEPFPGGLPTRQILDALVPDRPAYLTSYDGHTGWANSLALKLAGITRRSKNPVNGVIVKDARTGEPTGVLKEAAMSVMSSHLPQPTPQEKVAAVQAAITEAHRRGVTSVQTASGSPEELEIYDELRKKRTLDLRVYAALSATPNLSAQEIDAFDALREKYADDPLFKAGAIKLMADGVIESHTAAMLEPYSNRPAASGEPRFTPDSLNRLVTELDRRGWQVMIHAIGDRAIRMALDAFEQATATNPVPPRGRRHRIEHIETIDPADVPRFGQLGVIASMQPFHGLPDPAQIAVWRANIGEDRAARAWMYGSIAKRKGALAFGSDWPVVPNDPLLGLHVAVNRATVDGEPEFGWIPSERLTVEQALDAYTRGAAWASFDEHRKGSIARDMLADIVVLTKDIFGQPPQRLGEAEVAATIFDGRVVYQRSTETN